MRRAARVLIDTVYEPHYQHYAADFGTTIAGFFSDEPEIGNGHLYEMGKKIYEIEDQPWSREVEAELKERWGENYHKFLPLIWEQPVDGRLLARVRYDYMDTVTKSRAERFFFPARKLVPGPWCGVHRPSHRGQQPAQPHRAAAWGTISEDWPGRICQVLMTLEARYCPGRGTSGQFIPDAGWSSTISLRKACFLRSSH